MARLCGCARAQALARHSMVREMSCRLGIGWSGGAWQLSVQAAAAADPLSRASEVTAPWRFFCGCHSWATGRRAHMLCAHFGAGKQGTTRPYLGPGVYAYACGHAGMLAVGNGKGKG